MRGWLVVFIGAPSPWPKSAAGGKDEDTQVAPRTLPEPFFMHISALEHTHTAQANLSISQLSPAKPEPDSISYMA